ncbi:MAG TPA: histidine kinase [Casimicrobiaceae bacterium]|nr:histidine kinase [Casimicrobiaceae bacterium]
MQALDHTTPPTPLPFPVQQRAHARRPWRTALNGLTPQVVAIVLVLLVLRSVGTDIGNGVRALREDRLGTWVVEALGGLTTTGMMAVTMLVIVIGVGNLGPQQGRQRIAALAAAVVISAGIGTLCRLVYMTWPAPFFAWNGAPGFALYIWPRYALLGGLLTVVAEFYRRERASTAAAREAYLDGVALERELTAAQLQMLQAQIEPHFLFNTLANLRRLYDEDAAAGRTMLRKLMRYFEVALPRMRDGESTLDCEIELVEAFLHIQRIRMGHRLAFSVDVASELRPHPVPPMMLLTLVENAIKHGLNPLAEGGRVRVAAHVERDHLILTVADTGVGFGTASGSGIGLANIAARLASQFGDRAALALENNELGGATATIALPLALRHDPRADAVR